MAAAAQRTKRTASGSAMIGAKTIPDDHAILAVPKKGRLNQKVMAMLDGAGLEYTRPDRVDVAVCDNLPIVLVFLPASDIAKFVGEGNVDLGITGQDHVMEAGVDVNIEVELGFGKCSLSVQAPVTSKVTDVKQQVRASGSMLVPLQSNAFQCSCLCCHLRKLCGKRIATSFPKITTAYFAKLDSTNMPEIRELSGSVEAACGLGLADAVVDLVETGTTMRAAGLDEVEVIMKTQACLLSNKQSVHEPIIRLLKTRIEGYLTATRFQMISYNVPRDKLAEALLVGH